MTNLILTAVAALIVGLVVGAIAWQLIVCAPEIAMADADREAAIEDRNRARAAFRELADTCAELTHERAVLRHQQRDLENELKRLSAPLPAALVEPTGALPALRSVPIVVDPYEPDDFKTWYDSLPGGQLALPAGPSTDIDAAIDALVERVAA